MPEPTAPVDTQMSLDVDGEATTVTAGTTGAELFLDRRDVVVVRVNGELKDLDQPLPERRHRRSCHP